jgi:hypothetical protein
MQRHKKDIQNEETSFSRIVIKFYDHARINYARVNDIGETLFHRNNATKWQDLIKSHPLIQIDKLFTSISNDNLIELVDKAREADKNYRPPDLLTYYVITCPASIHPNDMLLKLNVMDEVELAYIQSTAISPPEAYQKRHPVFPRKYSGTSPLGINAKYAWKIKGGKGSPHVKFIDLEQGWNFGAAMNVKTLPLTGINNRDFGAHGAAVLGVIMMKETDKGCMGITPNADGYVISQWRPGGEPNDADAVLAAITYLGFGDILLLETQSFYSVGNNKIWPAEIHDATFQVIRLATALGIIIIEAAGNGDSNNISGNDLDYFSSNKKRILNPASREFRDSGAIMVSAASMDVPHSRISYSNFGKRINCYAWGEGVVTGENDRASAGTVIHPYTTGFNGTSSASAIIAGVAIAVQSIYETRYDMRLSPSQMRRILSSDRYGTVSANGRAKDKIGVMPDLKKIIDHGLPVAENLMPGS